jgi:hypothetical protein
MDASLSQPNYWLFSREIDLTVFLGSALAALLLLAVGWQFGYLNGESPEWTWVTTVLFIDVAHVWSTSFRVYFDKAELKRRFWLYLLVPVFGYALGVAVYSEGELLFWKCLAVIAVFHFIRQQYGWVNLYRHKRRETGRVSWWIDTVAIYIATVYPIAFWMSSLPRNFEWFVKNDFIAIPSVIQTILFPVYVGALSVYFGKSAYLYLKEGFLNIGKDIVVATTAVCWYVGIVFFNSDYAFTVTNVIIHGVPYFALIYMYAKFRRERTGRVYRTLSSHWLVFLATLWAMAYFEELFWHRGVWHEKQWLFGGDWDWSRNLRTFLAPLLALPQLTHYVLDGFVWRRKNNPDLKFI